MDGWSDAGERVAKRGRGGERDVVGLRGLLAQGRAAAEDVVVVLGEAVGFVADVL